MNDASDWNSCQAYQKGHIAWVGELKWECTADHDVGNYPETSSSWKIHRRVVE